MWTIYNVNNYNVNNLYSRVYKLYSKVKELRYKVSKVYPKFIQSLSFIIIQSLNFGIKFRFRHKTGDINIIYSALIRGE